MDVVTPLMQTLQAQANLDHTRAVTQDTQALGTQRMLNTQLLNNRIQQDLVTKSALQQALAGMPQMSTDLDPTPNDSAIQLGQKNVQRLQVQAQRADVLADSVLKAGGDPLYVDKLRDDATQARYRATQAQRELMNERSQQAKTIGSLAMSAQDEDSFRPAYQQIAKTDPQLAQSLILDRDTLGAPVWGPKTQRTMTTLASQGMTAHEQMEATNKAADIASKAALREDQAAERRAKVDKDDADAALSRTKAKVLEAGLDPDTGAPRAKVGAAAKPVSARPATKSQKDSALDAVTTEYPDVKFEPGAKDRLAADVADRANSLVAQAKNSGDDLSYDDARDQALQDLKGYVANKTTKKERGFGLLPDEVVVTKTYTRGGKGAAAPTGTGTPSISSQAEYDALPKGATYVWNGKTLTKK